ncbi:MAG: hypothetical protein NW224_09345 [Leptolyngbyaceae cyanobacterium bins.302]|nr:hypothetical protein [Leptolyngbyaceae cyanobacterium bins.302]
MLKRVIHQSNSLMFACLLLLSLWFLSPAAVQAGKAMKAMVFDGSSGTIEIATVYETSYSAQKMLVKSLKTKTKAMKKAAGFKGSSMLQSQDGKQVIAFSQWQDVASYQTATAASGASASSKSTTASTPLVPPEPTRVLKYEIATVQTSISGATPALRGKEAVVQLAQFTAKDPVTRSQIRTKVKQLLPQLLQKQPIPQSIVLLTDVETGDVALMTNWNCSALFEDVGKPSAIELSDDLLALVDSTQQLFNVTSILPATEVKPDKESIE